MKVLRTIAILAMAFVMVQYSQQGPSANAEPQGAGTVCTIAHAPKSGATAKICANIRTRSGKFRGFVWIASGPKDLTGSLVVGVDDWQDPSMVYNLVQSDPSWPRVKTPNWPRGTDACRVWSSGTVDFHDGGGSVPVQEQGKIVPGYCDAGGGQPQEQ